MFSSVHASATADGASGPDCYGPSPSTTFQQKDEGPFPDHGLTQRVARPQPLPSQECIVIYAPGSGLTIGAIFPALNARPSGSCRMLSRSRDFDFQVLSGIGDTGPINLRIQHADHDGTGGYREEMEDHAVGYMRVSSNQRLEDGTVAAQEASIRSYCLQHDLQLLRIDRDQAGSDSEDLDTRTGVAAALRSLEAGEASVLVVYDRTQLSGDSVLLETTIQRIGQAGACVLSIMEPDNDGNEDTNALIHRVLGGVDQYNKAVIRAKTEASQAHAGAEGRRSPSPYGYRSERGRLLQVPGEQEVLARIRQLRGAGASLRAICREMNDAGVTARAGGRWRSHHVAGALHTGALGDEAR